MRPPPSYSVGETGIKAGCKSPCAPAGTIAEQDQPSPLVPTGRCRWPGTQDLPRQSPLGSPLPPRLVPAAQRHGVGAILLARGGGRWTALGPARGPGQPRPDPEGEAPRCPRTPAPRRGSPEPCRVVPPPSGLSPRGRMHPCRGGGDAAGAAPTCRAGPRGGGGGGGAGGGRRAAARPPARCL